MIHDLRRLRGVSDATVICTPGEELDEVRREGFRVITVRAHRKISPLLDLVTIRELVALFRKERFDIVHTYTPKAGLLGQIAAALAGVRARLHSCRGLLYMPATPPLRRALFRLTDRITNTLARRVIYISRADRDFSVEQRLCAADRARFTGSAIDLSVYDAGRLGPDARLATRRRVGVPDDATLILTVGRFVHDKGYRELAAAVPDVVARFRRARFVWVAPVLEGEDGTLPDSFLRDARLDLYVTRTGLLPDLVDLYAAADLLVHPSYREGVPRAVIEAAAMGVPVICSDIPGCREVLPNGATAVFVPPGQADALRDALLAVLADPAAARERADEARRLVRARFDQDALTDRIAAIYREVLGEQWPSRGYAP